MKIPKYVINLMERSEYEYDRFTKDKNYAVGYTIRIEKERAYQWADTLKYEVLRLCNWANRTAKCETAFVLYVPEKTHHTKQYAYVTIFDPIMKELEKFVKNH